jgi:hypothetical protein
VALPTGLFVPSILCGAAYGRLVGVFVADLRPVTGSSSSIDEGTYALLGAASFLGKAHLVYHTEHTVAQQQLDCRCAEQSCCLLPHSDHLHMMLL